MKVWIIFSLLVQILSHWRMKMVWEYWQCFVSPGVWESLGMDIFILFVLFMQHSAPAQAVTICLYSAHEHDPSQCVIVNNLNTTLCLNQNVFCEQLAIFYWGIACVGVKVIDHWALTVVMTCCCVCGSNLFSPTNHKQMELCRVLQKLMAGSKQKWLIVLVDDITEKSRYCCDQPSVHLSNDNMMPPHPVITRSY